MWSNVISIDKTYDREIDYILSHLQTEHSLSFALEESKSRLWIYLAGLCERQSEIDAEMNEIMDTVFLSFFKLRFYLRRLSLRDMSYAKCALICSLLHFDRDFELEIVKRNVEVCSDYSLDGIMNFRLRELVDGWEEIASLVNDFLSNAKNDNEIYEISSFITGNEKKSNQLVLKDGNIRNLTRHKSAEIIDLFSDDEYNTLNAVIKEKPKEILLENCNFSKRLVDTLKKTAVVIEK